MHHFAAGPSRSARFVALLSRCRLRLGNLLSWLSTTVARSFPRRGASSVAHRRRIVPVTVSTFLLGVLALAAPMVSRAVDPPGSAEFSATAADPTDGGLVPAVPGPEWTQDGAPASGGPGEGTAPGSLSAATGAHGRADTSPATGTTRDIRPPAPGAPDSGAPNTEPADATATGGSGTTRPGSGATPPGTGATGASASETSESAATTTPLTTSGTTVDPPPPPTTTTATTTTATTTTATTTGPTVQPPPPPANPPPPAADPAPLDPAGEALARVNAARAAAGCGDLAADADLDSVATEHSDSMRDLGFVGLVRPDGGSVLDLAGTAAAVAGVVPDPSGAVSGWLADDRAAVLGCDLTSAGVGEDGGYWTLLTA